MRPRDKKPVDKVPLLGFSPDGRYLLAAFDTWATIWDTTAKQVKFHLRDPDPKSRNAKDQELEAVQSFAFLTNNSLLVNGHGYSKRLSRTFYKLVRYDLTAGSAHSTQDDHLPIQLFALSPKADLCAARTGDALVLLDKYDKQFRVKSTLMEKVENGREQAPEGLAFSPSGNYLISVTNEVKVFDMRTGEELKTSAQTGDRPAVFVDDDQFVLIGSTLRFYDVRTGALDREIDLKGPHIQKNTQRDVAAFMPGIKIFASGAGAGEVLVRDLRDGAVKIRCAGHTGEIRSMALSSDGKWLATSANDQTIKLWDIQ